MSFDSTHVISCLVRKPFPITLERKYAADHDFSHCTKDADDAVANAVATKRKTKTKRAEQLENRADELYKDVS